MTDTAKETFNAVCGAVKYDFSKPNLGVDLSASGKVVESASFTDLPELLQCAEVANSANKYNAFKPGMTKEELAALCDKYNRLNLATGKLPIMVEKELGRRNKLEVGKKIRA